MFVKYFIMFLRQKALKLDINNFVNFELIFSDANKGIPIKDINLGMYEDLTNVSQLETART